MIKNSYWNRAIIFENKIKNYTSQILRVYGFQLDLMMNQLNLLNNENNSIESSTAIGFCVEEFIVSKLEMYTKSLSGSEDFTIKRINLGTQTSSFDCYAEKWGEKFMINIKVDKKHNDGVAALNKLWNDYVKDVPDIPKHYMILKFKYSIQDFGDKNYKNRQIRIDGIETYFLEQIDFSSGHKQDNRNWSENFNKNSGRLIITEKFKEENKINVENISYKNTYNQINEIYKNNNKAKEVK